MKKTKKILIGLVVVISLLITLPFLIPAQTYLHKVESMASEKLGVPVTITAGHLLLLPSPRVVASEITVGKNQEIKVGRLAIIPRLGSVFSTTKSIDLKISKPIITKAALELLSAFSAKSSQSSEAATINIHRVTIDDMQFDWTDAKIPIINVKVSLTDTNKLESAAIETIDGKLKADVTPSGEGYLILVNAEKWILPVGLPVLIDSAKLEMHLKDSRLEVPKINVALYNGQLTGNTVLSWDKNWRLSGHIQVENLSVKEPTSLVSKSTYLSGNLFGNGGFSANAKDAGQLFDNIRADFRFRVNKGVLHGVDLVKAASLLIKQGLRGGETEFDEFSGLLNVTGNMRKQYHLTELKISSGILAATGQVTVSTNKELDGMVEVAVKRSVSMVAMPLVVSGTLSNPVVLPSKAAMAGAVAGTAVFGPGVGTSLGIKAGGAIDKIKGLFSGK